jgi:hypothetical protein
MSSSGVSGETISAAKICSGIDAAKLFVKASSVPIFSIPIRSLRTKWSQTQNIFASRGLIDRIAVTFDSSRVKI